MDPTLNFTRKQIVALLHSFQRNHCVKPDGTIEVYSYTTEVTYLHFKGDKLVSINSRG